MTLILYFIAPLFNFVCCACSYPSPSLPSWLIFYHGCSGRFPKPRECFCGFPSRLPRWWCLSVWCVPSTAGPSNAPSAKLTSCWTLLSVRPPFFNLSCMALDQYIAVCDPLHYPTRMCPRRVAMLLLLCWILPLVISSLCVSLGTDTYSLLAVVSSSTQQDTQTCLATFHIPYAFATSDISFLIPMGFMLFAYRKIFKAAQRQARWIHAIDHHTGHLQMNQSSVKSDATKVQARVERHSLKKRQKAVKTLGLNMGLFLICWLPFFCVNVVHPLKGYSVSPLVLEASMWLGYANSSLNRFLYALFNKNYHHVFAAMLDCGLLGRQLRAGLDSQAHTVVTLETISR